MRIALVTRDALIQLGAAVLVPIAPLALTMMPFEELAKRLFGLPYSGGAAACAEWRENDVLEKALPSRPMRSRGRWSRRRARLV